MTFGFAALLAAGCRSGDASEKKDKVADSKAMTKGDDDDDLSVVEPVPIALVDDLTLSKSAVRLKNQGAPQSAGGGYVSYIGRIDTLSPESLADKVERFNSQLQVLLEPSYVVPQLGTLIGASADFLKLVFADQGLLNGADIKCGKKGKKIYDLRTRAKKLNAALQYVIAYRDAASGYDYSLDFYAPHIDAGKFYRRVKLDFSPIGTGKDIKAHMHIADPHDKPLRYDFMVDLSYRTDTAEISVAFGQNPVTKDTPLSVYGTLKQLPDRIEMMGGMVWSNTLDARVSPVFPRYLTPRLGDVETFNLVARSSGDYASVQQSAYFTKDEAAAAEKSTAADYATKDLLTLELLSMVKYIRTAATNATCNKTGTDLGNKLPTDVCASNKSVTDADVAAAIKAACRKGDLAKIGDLDPCSRFELASSLTNPVTTTVTNGFRNFTFDTVGLKERPFIDLVRAEDKTLNEAMTALPDLTFSVMSPPGLLDVTLAAEADFKGAEEVP